MNSLLTLFLSFHRNVKTVFNVPCSDKQINCYSKMVYFLINRFGAIQLTEYVTRLGRRNCDIRLYSLACSYRHASIIQRADDTVSIINHSDDEPIFINRTEIEPGQSVALIHGDTISFSGDDTFKFVKWQALPSVYVDSSRPLSPD